MLFVVGGTLARTVHQSAVPHRLCEVHGTLEHAPEPGSARDSHVEHSPEVSLVGSTDEGTPYRPDSEPHEECEVESLTRTGNGPRLEAASASVLLLEPNGTNFVRQTPAPRTAIHREAPSRSPPA